MKCIRQGKIMIEYPVSGYVESYSGADWICKLKNLCTFCKRVKMLHTKKCREARKIENPHVLNTVFNTWGDFFEKTCKNLFDRRRCCQQIGSHMCGNGQTTGILPAGIFHVK